MAKPAWQTADATQESSALEQSAEANDLQPVSSPRTALIAKAAKFLDDEDIQNATIDKKEYFLRTKGLTDDEIDQLLQHRAIHVSDSVIEDLSSREGSNPSKTTTMESNTSSDGQQNPSKSSPETSNTAAPIITYPEFLFHSSKPPPLVTTNRLLIALYAASGTAATMYGLSNYILEPMFQSLISARHSLFETAGSNIDSLNEKLTAAVSQVPETAAGDEGTEDSEHDSVSSDPARFFARTRGTQTSPQLSRSPSSSSVSDKAIEVAIDSHASNLSRLRGLLQDLRPPAEENFTPLADNIDTFSDYMRKLPVWGKTGQVGPSLTNGSVAEADGITRLKNEIKSTKGALLSARNFPSGVGVR